MAGPEDREPPMTQPPSPYPPPGPRPLLRAVGVLVKGPLGVVLALLVGVGGLALADGVRTETVEDVRVPERSAPTPARGQARSPQANLWVDSDVVGALVVVGGDTTGVTPVWVRGITPGFVRVAVSSRGFKRDTTVYVGDGDDLDLSVRLGAAARRAAARAPAPPPPSAVAEDAPEPESAASESDTPPSPSREPGPATVRSQPAPPARPEPRPARRERGELQVSAPPGTALYVNGRFRSRIDGGPATVLLPPGDHRVRVIYPSLALEETTVYVGRTIVVSLSFGPDPRG